MSKLAEAQVLCLIPGSSGKPSTLLVFFPRQAIAHYHEPLTRTDTRLSSEPYSRLFDEVFIQVDGGSIEEESDNWGIWSASTAGDPPAGAKKFRLLGKTSTTDSHGQHYRSLTLGPIPGGRPLELVLLKPRTLPPGVKWPSLVHEDPRAAAAPNRIPETGTLAAAAAQTPSTLVADSVRACRTLTDEEITRLRTTEKDHPGNLDALLRKLGESLGRTGNSPIILTSEPNNEPTPLPPGNASEP